MGSWVGGGHPGGLGTKLVASTRIAVLFGFRVDLFSVSKHLSALFCHLTTTYPLF